MKEEESYAPWQRHCPDVAVVAQIEMLRGKHLPKRGHNCETLGCSLQRCTQTGPIKKVLPDFEYYGLFRRIDSFSSLP